MKIAEFQKVRKLLSRLTPTQREAIRQDLEQLDSRTVSRNEILDSVSELEQGKGVSFTMDELERYIKSTFSRCAAVN